MNRLKLRILPIDWHPRYSYMIAGLKVNGERKRLYFNTAGEAQVELKRLEGTARRQGEAGLNMPDELRGQAVDAAQRLKPYGKTIRDAADFYLNRTAAESARVGMLVRCYLEL